VAREELIARTGHMAVPVITVDDEVVAASTAGGGSAPGDQVMPRVACPDCGAVIDLPADVHSGDLVECPQLRRPRPPRFARTREIGRRRSPTESVALTAMRSSTLATTLKEPETRSLLRAHVPSDVRVRRRTPARMRSVYGVRVALEVRCRFAFASDPPSRRHSADDAAAIRGQNPALSLR